MLIVLSNTWLLLFRFVNCCVLQQIFLGSLFICFILLVVYVLPWYHHSFITGGLFWFQPCFVLYVLQLLWGLSSCLNFFSPNIEGIPLSYALLNSVQPANNFTCLIVIYVGCEIFSSIWKWNSQLCSHTY